MSWLISFTMEIPELNFKLSFSVDSKKSKKKKRSKKDIDHPLEEEDTVQKSNTSPDPEGEEERANVVDGEEEGEVVDLMDMDFSEQEAAAGNGVSAD